MYTELLVNFIKFFYAINVFLIYWLLLMIDYMKSLMKVTWSGSQFPNLFSGKLPFKIMHNLEVPHSKM